MQLLIEKKRLSVKLLHNAIIEGEEATSALLSDECIHINLDAKNDNNQTALTLACHNNQKHIVQMLIQHGADLNI